MLWNEKFAFGIKVIDEQHKRLYDLMDQTNALILDVEDGIDCYDEIEAVLHELESYTIYHFKDEERIMFKAGYEDFAEHKVEHDAFVAKIRETLTSDLDFQQEGVLRNLSEFLFEWVSNHILATDVKYVALLKKEEQL